MPFCPGSRVRSSAIANRNERLFIRASTERTLLTVTGASGSPAIPGVRLSGLMAALRLLVPLLSASVVWGAAYTTARSGNWNNADGTSLSSPWCSSGTCTIPGDGDTVIIGNGHTLTVPAGSLAIAGTNTGTDAGATPAIQTNGAAGTGILVVNGTLIFKGPVRQGNATWIVGPGATISHGGTAGVSYTWQISRANSQPNALLRINGTEAQPVTFTKQPGADNAGALGQGSFLDGGRVQATWANFSNWGTSILSPYAFVGYVGNPVSALFDTYFRNVTFDSCGLFQLSGIWGPGIKFEVSRSKFTNPLASNGRTIFLGAGGWSSTGITSGEVRLFDSNVIYGQFAVSSGSNPNDFTFRNNIFRNHGSTTFPLNFLSGSRVAAWTGNLIYSNAAGPVSFGTAIGGTLFDSLALRRSDNSSADVDMFRSGSVPKWDVTLDGWVFEYQDCGSSASLRDTGGDTYVIEGQDAARTLTHTIRNSIQLPNEDGGSNGTLMVVVTGATSDWSRTRVAVEHNTLLPTTNMEGVLKIGEGLASMTAPASLAVYRSNLAWRTAAGTGKFLGRAANAVTYPNGIVESADYNGRYNISGDPYSNLQASLYNSTVAPGTHDVNADPRFVDASRDFGSWALSVDSSLTNWDLAVAAMENTVLQRGSYNPSLTIPRALAWIRAGFAPQNAVYGHAAHDGGDIGAVSVGSVSVAVPVSLSSAASPVAGTPGLSAVTITGTGFPTGTIAPAAVKVTLAPAGSPAVQAVETVASSLTTLVGTTRRVTFNIPSSISVSTPALWQITISGSSAAGVSFSSSNYATITINPPARIASVSPTTASTRQSVSVLITGQFSSFLAGTTQASFGPGISVGGAAAGEFGPVTVTSATTAIALINTGATAGLRSAVVRTGTEIATLTDGFSVVEASVPVSSSVVVLSAFTSPAAVPPGGASSVSGSGFPSEIAVAQVSVRFQPVTTNTGPSFAVVVTALEPASGPVRQISFVVPASLRLAANTEYRVSVSATSGANVVFTSSNFATMTIQATTGRLVSVTPSSAMAGETVTVAIAGEYTNFIAGSATASFGPGISVGGAADGVFGPVNAASSGNVTAQLRIAPGASLGVHSVTVKSGAEQYTLSNCFEVLPNPNYLSLLSSFPGNAENQVPTNASIYVEFNKAVNPASVAAGIRVMAGGLSVAGTFSVEDGGKRVRFTPLQPLAPSLSHTVAVTAQLTDVLSGAVVNPATIAFTTAAEADASVPFITVVSPADAALDVATTSTIRVSFSEPVLPYSVSGATLRVTSGSGGTASEIAGSVVISPDRRSATFTPAALPAATKLNILISGVTDLAGNQMMTFTSSFTTSVAVAPALVF